MIVNYEYKTCLPQTSTTIPCIKSHLQFLIKLYMSAECSALFRLKSEREQARKESMVATKEVQSLKDQLSHCEAANRVGGFH